MGKLTEENRRKLELSDTYEDAEITNIVDTSFSDKLDDLFSKKHMSTQDIVNITGISKSYINKLRNRTEKKVNPDRNKIISIGLALNCNEKEINELLKAAHQDSLYARSKKESIIIWGLYHKKNYYEIWELLEQKGFGSMLNNKD